MRLVRLAAGDLGAAFAPDAGLVGCSHEALRLAQPGERFAAEFAIRVRAG